jgi:hypothetical protein
MHKDAGVALPTTSSRPYAADRMQQNGDTTTDRRVTVLEAAKLLNLTPDAIRARLRRGTLRKERAEDGTLLVVLAATDPDRPPTGRPTEQPTDPYIEGLKSRVELLERELADWKAQLEEEREANRENRRLLAALVQRVPELEAPSEPRDGPVRASEDVGEDDVPRPERRSFWRRLFG